MGWTVAMTLVGLMTLMTGLVTSYHVPDYNILPPLPDRSSISNNDNININSNIKFGSMRLPLRDAIESIPFHEYKNQKIHNKFDEIIVTSERLYVKSGSRDAVERRPPPSLGTNILDHNSVWLERHVTPSIRSSNDNDSSGIIICHLNSTGLNQNEQLTFLPHSIPKRKCTHIIYNGAVTIDHTTSILSLNNQDYDEVKGGFKSLLNLKKYNPSINILISIEFVNKYTTCCHDTSQLIIDFIDKYKFDGIDIDWKNSNDNDLLKLINNIRKSMEDIIIAVTKRQNDNVNQQLLESTNLLILRSWINHDVDKKSHHPITLEIAKNIIKKWTSIDSTGKLNNKIILSVPLFGYSFKMKYKNSTYVNKETIGPGIEGAYTKNKGKLGYYEICDIVNQDNTWIGGRDDDGAYIKRGDQWIGYDDPITLKIISAYIKTIGIGGVSLFTLDLDDFIGICGDQWPMLNSAFNIISDDKTNSIGQCQHHDIHPDDNNCARYFICDDGKLYNDYCGKNKFYDSIHKKCVKATAGICKQSNINEQYKIEKKFKKKITQRNNNDDANKMVVCYVTSWSLYRKDNGKFVPENLDKKLCSHIIYAFAGLNSDRLLIQEFDPWADIDNKLYERITMLKDSSKVLLALGGWTDSTSDKYSRLVSNSVNRKKFISNTIDYLIKNNFDGISIEWNYPKCWQSDCTQGPDTDRPNFTKFINELRDAFDDIAESYHLTLAVSVSGYKEIIDRAYDIDKISKAVDFMSVMTFDYAGSWETTTGHLAPLYTMPNDKNPYYNINWTMNYLTSLGAEKNKLLIGIPFYGQSYRLSKTGHSSMGDSASGPGMPGEFTNQPGMLAYYEICDRIKRQSWKTGAGPSAYKNNQFVSYDDSMSVEKKAKWIVDNDYGGVTAWTVDLDDFTNKCCRGAFPLLKSLNNGLGRIADPSLFNIEDCTIPKPPITPEPPIMTAHSDAHDGDSPKPTRPMTSTTMKSTTWPTWTEKPMTTTSWIPWSEKPSKKPSTTTTSWPSWSWKPDNPTTSSSTTRPTTTTTKKPIIHEPELINTPGGSCDNGDYSSDPNNCGTYYRCIQGMLRREYCAPGLHWDHNKRVCDWPSLVKCQSGTQKPAASTTKRPITSSTTTTTVKPNIPTHCQHGQYYPYPESCTQFLICVNDNLVMQNCGPGLNWNDDKKMCDWAFKKSCTMKPNKNLQFSIKNENNECISGSFNAVDGDCSSYQYCLWGKPEIKPCPPGLHFNKQTSQCDWPENANCDVGNIVVTTSSTADNDKTNKPSNQLTTTTTRRPIKPTIKPTNKPTNKPTVKPTIPSAEIDPAKVSTLSGYYKVVCYFTNWAWYRRGSGKYLPQHIDHTLCTHIIYGFAVLDYSELTIKAHDSWADYDNNFYEKVVAYKKRGLKVLLALGGWNDSAGDKYSRLVNSASSRKKFIDHAIKFINKYGFDGIDLDWEYPVCWQVDCKKGPSSDKNGFTLLVKELNIQLKKQGQLLSSAVSPSKMVIDAGYDVPELSKYLDWISVMTYDYFGQWDKKTGHVAPLYHHQDIEPSYFNANFTINYWISKGASPRKLVMGIPLYGQSFTIHDPNRSGHGLNAPASAGLAGEFTQAAGFLAYYEICDRINNHGWTVVQDENNSIGPYAYKGNQWVSFDDVTMVKRKAQFIRDNHLGGGMIWALDLDDFRGKCGHGRHPLLSTLQQVLASPPNDNDKTPTSVIVQPTTLTPPKKMKPFNNNNNKTMNSPSTTTTTSTTSRPTTHHNKNKNNNNNNKFKVVCYFTNWAWYRQEGGKFMPEDIDPDLCTHIIYGFAVLDSSTLTIKTHDSWADIDNKFYERVVAYKTKGIKVSIAIGGWNDSAGDKYSKLVNSLSSRSRFIKNIIEFIDKYGFDGLDLDWEYPVCWQVDCTKGPESDKESFTMFVKELSDEFKPRGLLLSSAVSPSKRVIDAGYDVSIISKYLDWIAIMAYDYHGHFDKKTGHVAPLYVRDDDWEMTFNANFTVNYWLEKGAPANKLVMGMPLYGQSFSLAETNVNGLNSATYGGGEAGDSTRARGFLSYYEICEKILFKGWNVVQDPKRRIGPYAYKADQWVSFDDVEQIKLKSEFVKNHNLAGAMVWALDLDDFENRCGCEPSPLLRTINRVLRNYPAGPTCSLNVHNINNKPTKITTTTTSKTIIENGDSVEVISGPAPTTMLPIGECNENEQYKPHKDDCSKYLICNFGQVSVLSCPNGLYWNLRHCDWPENTKCKNHNNKKQ
ncbi:hypothetical protein HCN44_004013 [Aphidius gifuensis]|uniref:chitinase n=1 Tax=Aphidius gifuensis TaxID=684658 RepID=A0A834XXC0_APHGI|nr:probable chitinase 10 [Aphidius gifuensis]KAF7994541.1 hypothetical protein HCN44_004013 [Aphidius gifuensis]